MAGLLISSPVAGQMADSLGRKPAFFLSLLVLTVCNLIAAFSVSWEMFAACRFLIGFGCGMYLTTFYSFMQEFVPTRWRSMTAAVPGWAIFAALYGLFSWWLHDWEYLHYATAIVTAPFLLGILWVFYMKMTRKQGSLILVETPILSIKRWNATEMGPIFISLLPVLSFPHLSVSRLST